MKKLLLILLLCPPLTLSHADELSNEILSIVLPLGNKTSPIKTSGCNYQKEKWGKLLLTKETFKETITFSKDCDLEGEFSPKIGEFFDLNLKIKNHKKIVATKLKVKLTIKFEEMPLLQLEILNSTLMTKDKNHILFNLTYGQYLDLLSKDPLGKPKGGTLKVLKLGLKTINKTIKI